MHSNCEAQLLGGICGIMKYPVSSEETAGVKKNIASVS